MASSSADDSEAKKNPSFNDSSSCSTHSREPAKYLPVVFVLINIVIIYFIYMALHCCHSSGMKHPEAGLSHKLSPSTSSQLSWFCAMQGASFKILEQYPTIQIGSSRDQMMQRQPQVLMTHVCARKSLSAQGIEDTANGAINTSLTGVIIAGFAALAS